MTSYIRFSAIAAALAISAVGLPISSAHASCGDDSCTGTIESLYVQADATGSATALYINPEGSVTPLDCTDDSGISVYMPLDTEARKAAYQLLLAAYLAGKTVTIKLPASGNCVVRWVRTED